MKNDRDDDLLRTLGRFAAEEERLSPDDQELELMCAGQLPEERIRALEARAAGEPELARRLDAYRPLDAGSRAKLTAALVHEVSSASGSTFAPADGRQARDQHPPVRRVNRARFPSARSLGSAVAAIAVAAAVAMVWVNHRRSSPGQAAPLPGYQLDIVGGMRELRAPAAPDGGPIRLRPGSPVQLLVRPASATRERIVVESFLMRDVAPDPLARAGDEVTFEPLTIPFEISPDGAARARGNAAALFGVRRGRWRLVLIVERASAPRDDSLRRAQGSDGPYARRVGVDLWLLDGP